MGGETKKNQTPKQTKPQIHTEGGETHLLDLVEELLLVLHLLGLGAPEVGVIELLVDLDAGNINLGRGGNDVRLVDTTEGNTVDLEGAVDQEEARLELLEEHDPPAAEATGEENENGSGGDVGAQLGGGGLLGLLVVDGGGLSLVEAAGLLQGHLALPTVLLASDLLNLEGLGLLLNLGVRLLLVQATLGEHR